MVVKLQDIEEGCVFQVPLNLAFCPTCLDNHLQRYDVPYLLWNSLNQPENLSPKDGIVEIHQLNDSIWNTYLVLRAQNEGGGNA